MNQDEGARNLESQEHKRTANSRMKGMIKMPYFSPIIIRKITRDP